MIVSMYDNIICITNISFVLDGARVVVYDRILVNSVWIWLVSAIEICSPVTGYWSQTQPKDNWKIAEMLICIPKQTDRQNERWFEIYFLCTCPRKRIFILFRRPSSSAKRTMLPVTCFGGHVSRRAVSIDRKSGCVITSVPNVSYKRKILPLQRVWLKVSRTRP